MSQGYRVVFTVGTGTDKLGLEISEQSKFAYLIYSREWLAKTFGGYTETEHSGGWIDPRGKLIQESSVSFTVIVDGDLTKVDLAAQRLLWMFQQEQVLVTKEPIEYEFVLDRSIRPAVPSAA